MPYYWAFFIGLMIGMAWGVSRADGIMRVAIVDTGLDLRDPRFAGHLCPEGHKDFTGTGLKDRDGHGTHIAGLIVTNAPKFAPYCLVILKFYDPKLDKGTQVAMIDAMREATSQGAIIVNLSSGGLKPDLDELSVIKRAPNTLFIGAAGNQGEKVRSYPGCYGLNNTRCVGATRTNGLRASFSNYGPWVNVWHPGVDVKSYALNGGYTTMSGTSMATAIETGLEIGNRFKDLKSLDIDSYLIHTHNHR